MTNVVVAPSQPVNVSLAPPGKVNVGVSAGSGVDVTIPTGPAGPPGPDEIFVGPDEPIGEGSEHLDLWFDTDAEAYYAEGPPGPPGPVSPDLRFDVRSYGVKGDGSDDKAALQAAFNSADPLVIPLDLKVSVASQVLIPAGLDLLIDGRIERMWGTGGGGGTGAMFYAAGGSADHVKISGTGSVGAVSQAIGGGQIFNGRYDDALFEEFAVDIYWGGLAYCILGDRIRMNMAKVYNSGVTVGTGGIRFLGGDDFVATACHIESGDDALQFVPGEAGGQPPTRRGVYQGCTGFSTNARFIAVAIGGTSASDVEDCSFIGCHGKASKRGIVVTIQEVATGSIKGLSIRDCSVNCTNDVQATARGGMYITNEQTSGTAVIEDVVIDNVAIKNPMSQAGYFERINRLTVINSRFESSRTPFTSDVVATNCPDLKFDNNVVYGGGTTSTLLLTGGAGGPEPACNRAIVENNKIFNIANAAYGIEARLGSDLLIPPQSPQARCWCDSYGWDPVRPCCRAAAYRAQPPC